MLTADQLDTKHAQATPEQVKGIVDFLKGGVENVIKGRAVKGIDPILAVYCYDVMRGKHEMRVHMLDTGFNTPLEKKLAMKAVAASIYNERLLPVAVGLVSEAWMAHETKEQVESGKRRYLQVADNPDRKEVAFIAAASFYRPDGKPLTCFDVRYVSRDKDDQISWDGDWLSKDGESKNMDASILDNFFRSFVAFASKSEDPETYLHGRKVVPINL